MLPEGHSVEALTKEAAMSVLAEVVSARWETARYRQAVAELRSVLEVLEHPGQSRLPAR